MLLGSSYRPALLCCHVCLPPAATLCECCFPPDPTPPHTPHFAQAAGVQGSSATYAALCEVFQQQGKWDKLRTAVQVKGGQSGAGGRKQGGGRWVVGQRACQ